MKALKKLTAIALAVCMLIGMPLSIDIAATGAPNNAEFKLASGMIIPDRWGTTLDGDTQMSLYFTGGPITIDTSKVKVIVGLGANSNGWWDGKQLNKVVGVWLTGTLSQSNELLGGTASSGKRNPNNWIFTVNNEMTWAKADFKPEMQAFIEGDKVDTLTELKALGRMSGSDLMVKIIETSGTAGNGVIDGITEGTTKLVAKTKTANVAHGNLDGANDGTWAMVYDENDAPQMTGAYLDDAAKTLTVRFNKGIRYEYKGDAYTFVAIRVIDDIGRIYCYTTEKGFYQFIKRPAGEQTQNLVQVGGFSLEGSLGWDASNKVISLTNDQYTKLKDVQAKVAAHNATATEKLKVAFIVEENNGAIPNNANNTFGHKVVEGRGEGQQNFYQDSVWTADAEPFMPNYTSVAYGVADIMAKEVLTIDQLRQQSVTIEKVTPVARIGMSDRLVVEFSEAVNIPAIDSYVRVFDNTGKLMTHDPATGKLTPGGTSGHLQWSVSGWTKADADGKIWIANLGTNFECDTYDEIANYVGALTNEDGSAASGLKIALSMVDKERFKVAKNYLTDSVTAVADSSKKLFADNTQDPGEDRATCAITEGLSVVDVSIYANEYAIVTFSEAINVDAAIASMSTNNFWLGAHKNPSTGDDPVQDANLHIHSKLVNARKFGNATNKLLFDLNGGWAAFKARLDAYEAANGAVDVCVRVEGGGAAHSAVVPGITSADGTLKLYRSNPANWGGRLMIATELIPMVSVANVKADTNKNALIVTFSEPVKYTAQQVTLNDGKGGTYTAMRSQVALQRFKTADMTLDMDNLYQSNATAFTASDANGNAVSDEYSTYWTFTFGEGVVETAVNYYASGNPAYSDEIGYGFGVYEASSAGTWAGGLADASLVLPLHTYCDDFATAPDAKGTVKYLKASSISSGVRFFKAVTIDPSQQATLIDATECKMISADTLQITFSEPVKVLGGGWNSIRVTENNNLVGPDNADYQLGGALTAVNPDADGYSAVWNFKASTQIAKFAHDRYFNNDYSKNAAISLCMSFQANGGSIDGMTDHVVGKNGGVLKASPYHRGAEGTYLNFTNDPMLVTDQIIQKVELVGQNDAFLTLTPIQSYGGTKSWRIIDGATGVTKVINGTEAVWNVTTWSNYLNGNKQMVASGMAKVLGVNTFDGIRGLMDADDKLVFAFSDNRVNGVIDDFFLTSADGYKLQKAHFSTATGDVAYFVVDTNVTKEALSVTDVSVYERVLQSYPKQDRYLVFTFSHDISDAALANIRNGNVAFWMTVKDTNSYNWWYNKNDGNGYVLNGSTPHHSQIAPGNFQRYGNTGNKLVAAVAGNAYVDLINHVNNVNAQEGKTAAELVVRMETSKLSGMAGVNTQIMPVDTNVLPMILDQSWNNGGRTYSVAFNDGRVIQVGSIELVANNKAEITFVDESGNPVVVTNKYYNPNGGAYVAIRLTKDGRLAWTQKAQINTASKGSPLQFDASLVTKNGTASDSTWVLNATTDIAMIIQALGDENGYLRKNGVDMAFGLEGGTVSGTGDINDYMDVFTTPDGKGILQMIKGDTNLGEQYRYFYSYLNHKNNWITNGLVKETVKVVKTEAVNNATLQITFDKPVAINTTQNYFRIVDDTNNLIRFDLATKEPLGNIMNVGEKDAAGSHAGLAQAGASVKKVDAEGKVWNFAINSGILGNLGFADIAAFVKTLPASGNWNGGLRFVMTSEGGTGTGPRNGVFEAITDGNGSYLANSFMGDYIGDGAAFDITEAMIADFTDAVEITEVKQINKHQLKVTFSEAVTIDNPFIGLRLVDENGELVWSTRDAQGNTLRAATGQGSAMQWFASGREMISDTEMIVTYRHDIGAILDASNLPAAISPTSNPELSIKLVIEETKPEDSGEAHHSGLVCDVVSKANPKKMLRANVKLKTNSWDGTAIAFTAMDPEALITVSDAKISGENQVTFEWSHSVDLTNPGNYFAAFRYVNADTHLLYGNDKDGWMQFGAWLNYVGDGMVKMTAHIVPNTKWGVYDIDDLLNPTGELKAYMDAHPGKWILRIEEKNGATGNGIVDTYFGKDGNTIQANPYIGNWADGVDMDIVGTPITGELKVVDMAIVSDTDVKVSFSAPIKFAQVTKDGKKVDSVPWVSMRLYNSSNQLLFWNPLTEEYTTVEKMFDKDGNPIYRNQHGYTTEKEGPDADGKWVPYARQSNVPMQWGTANWKWGDDKHTSIIYTLSGGAELPVKNITDILSYDFTKFIEGSYVGFDIEENTPAMIDSNGHVDNILRADNAKIALDANFFPHNRDSVMTRLEDMTLAYKPGKLVSKTEVISDTQIRVSFSQPVILVKEKQPFMAIRMIDKKGNLMWSGKENLSQPYQWSGTWEWEDETHTSFIWSMTQVNLGASTIYDLANWKGVLQKYKEEGTWMFVIEELDKGDFKVGRHNGLVDNITTKDGTLHLLSTYSKGLDGILTALDTSKLVGPALELLSAQALDDQTIKLTFNEPVAISDDVSMGVRYLSPSGDSEVLTDGKVAYFKGDWEYADDTKKVITWTLKTKNADNLTDIINYNGKFDWNKGARVAFVIMDAEDQRGTPQSMRIKGIFDTVSGFRTLVANYATKDYPMTQMDIEILYDIPAPEASGETGVEEVVYVTNYVPFIIASAVIAVAGLVVAIVLFKKRKKAQ